MEENQPTLVTTDDMITLMLRYETAKTDLEQDQEIGRRVIERVRANVDADLEPRRREIEDCRRSMEAYIHQNGGAKFKAPGLGSAYLSKRKSIRVVDENSFETWIESLDETDPRWDEVHQAVYPAKFSAAGAKKLAEQEIKESGEVLPGIEYEEVETLNVRLSGTVKESALSPDSSDKEGER